MFVSVVPYCNLVGKVLRVTFFHGLLLCKNVGGRANESINTLKNFEKYISIYYLHDVYLFYIYIYIY